MLVAYQRTDEAFVIAQAIETFTFYGVTAALLAIVAHDAIENDCGSEAYEEQARERTGL
jgi:hypothetical protein